MNPLRLLVIFLIPSFRPKHRLPNYCLRERKERMRTLLYYVIELHRAAGFLWYYVIDPLPRGARCGLPYVTIPRLAGYKLVCDKV